MRNFYSEMDLPNFATSDEIKAQYRRLAKEYHPDRYTGNTERFRNISEAFTVLNDTENKIKYDNELKITFEKNKQQNQSSDIWGFLTKNAMNVAENYVRNVANEYIQETEEYSPLVEETINVKSKVTKAGTLSVQANITRHNQHKLLVTCSKGASLEQYCLEVGEMVASELYETLMRDWEN